MKSVLSIGNISASPGEKAKGWVTIAELPGSKLEIPVAIANGKDDGPILFLNSGIHGSEYNPIEANIRLQKSFNPSNIKGAVISSIITNVPAFNSRTQYLNPIDGKNVNRLYPGKPDGTISDRIAYFVANEFVKKADYVFDMHGGDIIEDLGNFNIAPISGDSHLDEQTLMLDRCFGGDFVMISRGSDGVPSGTTTDEALRNRKPALTLEAGGMGKIEENFVDYHLNGVLNAMAYLKMIDGTPQFKEHKKVVKAYPINLNHGGIWHPKMKANMLVTKGQVLGEVTDPFGETLERIEAPAPGVILFYMYTPAMNAGDTVLWMGEFE